MINICVQCHKEFTARYKNRKHCSMLCAWRTRHEKEKFYSSSICIVPKCGKTGYCKGYCKNHYSRFKRTGNPLPKPKLLYRHTCPKCKKVITTYNKQHNKFCSSECRSAAWKGRRNGRWSGGKSEYKNHSEMKRNRIQKMRTQPNCELCGTKAYLVHHKDFTKENHAVNNLQSLCMRCHRKLHLERVCHEETNI